MSGATGRRWLRHAAVVTFFLLLACWQSYPLIVNPAAHVPGAEAADNISFLWNFWWFRFALAHPGEFFLRTGRLFAPFGTSLVLHTHTALPALLGATVFAWMPLVAAHSTLQGWTGLAVPVTQW